MYKLIICDDDEIILEGLSTVISWEEMGVTLKGTASNGQDAVDLIERYRPDILVTDIVMPFYSGFEIIEHAKLYNPGIVILVISGYDDFSYAKEAIRMGVQDYVSKPIDVQEMEYQIQKAVKKCEKLQRQMYQERVKFIQRICFSHLDPEEAFQQSSLVELHANWFYVNLLIWMDEENPEEESFFREIAELVREKECYSFVHENRQLCICVCAKTEKTVQEEREDIIRKIRSELKEKERNISVTIASGKIYRGIGNLGRSMQDARAALESKFVAGNNKDIFYSEAEHKNTNFWSGDEIFSINFTECVKACNKKKVHENIEKLYSILEQTGGGSYLFTQFTLCNLYMNLSKNLKESGINLGNLNDSYMENYKTIIRCDNLQASVTYFEKSLYEICDRIAEQRQGKHVSMVEEAKAYIQQHYKRSDLMVEEVAESVFMSRSYFSTIFKSVTGVSFTDYLIRVRMEKAKELICNTDERIGDIALEVGYDNPTYFSVAFKKYTGKSPTEYKNRI